MKIAIEGCAHGELEKIYDSIEVLEKRKNIKVDLLICCGDFQATRNKADLESMAVPVKYRQMCTFYKYYNGEKTAPVLTLFIGGNHEASNYLQELPYGGWVAPNIFYLGYAGVVQFGGLRIAGLSGIYKPYDYSRGHFESPPYNHNTLRSVYHIRNVEVFRLKQIKSSIDICLSHEWPRGIYNYGNVQNLVNIKPYFKEEISQNSLGSAPCEELLFHLKPRYWFAAHLHCKFTALVPHNGQSFTRFLALDKCLPKRKFMQILEIPHKEKEKLELTYDLEWLSILHFTNHLTSVKQQANYLPGPGCDERWDFTPTEEEKDFIFQKMGGDLSIPKNFHDASKDIGIKNSKTGISPNHQTRLLCEKLGIDDPVLLFSSRTPSPTARALSKSESKELSFSEDLSFIDSGNENSFTIIDKEESSPVPRERISLVLPPPKYNESPNDELKNDIHQIKEQPGEVKPDDGLFYIDISPKRTFGESEENVKTEPVCPTTKKFKRRNQNIYNATEE